MSPALHSLRHHARFYVALIVAAGAYAAGGKVLPDLLRPVVAGDVFFAVYLILAALAAAGASPDSIRQRAEQQDEGMVVVVLLSIGAIGLCLASNFAMLNAEPGQGPSPALRLGLAGLSVLLAWTALHTLFAFHYAHRFYANEADGPGQRSDRGGLDFPGTDEPDLMDFLYYSMVIGMTAQVSDVDATSRAMRRLTLGHSIIAFFFNTVILAFAVNAAVNTAGG